MRIGSVRTVSLGTVTTEAFSNEEYAWAATRSTGVAGLAEPRVVAAHRLDDDALGGRHLDAQSVTGRDGGAVVQPAQPRQRREPPLLLAAVGDREVRHVEGRGALMRVATVDSAATAINAAVVEPAGMF